MSISAALMKAVRAALIADATANGYLAGRVYSDWSTGSTYPLARISIPVEAEFEDDCAAGAEFDLRVNVYTKGGPVERSAIADAVKSVLRYAALTLDDAELRSLQWLQTLNVSEPDDPTMHGAVIRFRAIATAA